MNPAQTVIFTTIISFSIFGFAGTDALARTRNGISRLSGQPPTAKADASGPVFTPQVVTGWAVLFLILITLSDVAATSELAMAFAWLLLLSIALAFGPDAFDNITKLLGMQPEPAPAGTGGGTPPKEL